MTLVYTPLMWIVPIVMAITYAAFRLHRSRLTRPASRKVTKHLAMTMDEANDDPRNIVRGAVGQIQRDGITRRVRSWLARAAQALKALAAHDARIERLEGQHDRAVDRLDKSTAEAEEAKENPPYLGHGTVRFLNLTLLAGDITIVSLAIQASDLKAKQFEATAAALALAAALYILGKLLADALRDTYHSHGLAASIVAGGIVAFSIGLYLLRIQQTAAWVALACAPAIGAAGVSLLGPTRLQATAHRAEQTEARVGKRHETAIRRRGKVAGRIDSLLTNATLVLVANGYESRSISQMAGIKDGVTAYETVANELGISLGSWFQHQYAPATATGEATNPSNTPDEEPVAQAERNASEPSNGEGEHSLDLEKTSVFVPDVDITDHEEPS